MAEIKEHSYLWSDLRKRPARNLAVGDVVVVPNAAYITGRAGRVRPAVDSESPRGTVWTVIAREGDLATCRTGEGRTATHRVRASQRLLVVVPPEPVGTPAP